MDGHVVYGDFRGNLLPNQRDDGNNKTLRGASPTAFAPSWGLAIRSERDGQKPSRIAESAFRVVGLSVAHERRVR